MQCCDCRCGGPAEPSARAFQFVRERAFALYLPVLKLLEPRLKSGAVVLGENAFDRGYLDYVRDPANGYLSQSLPIDEGRGNEFTVRTL